MKHKFPFLPVVVFFSSIVLGLVIGWNFPLIEKSKPEPSQPLLTTSWVGCPMVSDDERYTPSQGWLTGVEMGLRSDGVIVWRNRKPTQR